MEVLNWDNLEFIMAMDIINYHKAWGNEIPQEEIQGNRYLRFLGQKGVSFELLPRLREKTIVDPKVDHWNHKD